MISVVSMPYCGTLHWNVMKCLYSYQGNWDSCSLNLTRSSISRYVLQITPSSLVWSHDPSTIRLQFNKLLLPTLQLRIGWFFAGTNGEINFAPVFVSINITDWQEVKVITTIIPVMSNPSWEQMTPAIPSWLLLHTLPQCPSTHTSTLPSLFVYPSTRLILELLQAVVISLNSDHSTICKF